MTREDRQKFWQDVMMNDEIDVKDRLKASALLAKSFGDFDSDVRERERSQGRSLPDTLREMEEMGL